MSDAYSVGVWHRYVLRRAGANPVAGAADAGITLVEILVAIVLLAVALIGTAGGIALYIKQQVVERSQVNANHLADSWFEYAESLARNTTSEATGGSDTNFASLTTAATNDVLENGVAFHEIMTPTICQPADLLKANFTLASCSGGALGATSTIYGTIRITWMVGGQPHQLSMTRNLADNSTYNPPDTNDPGGNAISNCTRAEAGAGTVKANALTVTPTTAAPPFVASHKVGATTIAATGPAEFDGSTGNYVSDATGTATAGVTVTLTETGLVNTTDTTQNFFGAADCVPLFWTDTNALGTAPETRQVDMHSLTPCGVNLGNYKTQSCTYTAVIPPGSMFLKFPAAATSWETTIPFCAWLLGKATSGAASTCPASNTDTNFGESNGTTFYATTLPSLNCMVTPAVSVGVLLGAVTATCNATNLPTTDVVTATYPTNNTGGTANLTLSFSGGVWKGTLGIGKPLAPAVLGTDLWSFQATRALDKETGPIPPATYAESVIA